MRTEPIKAFAAADPRRRMAFVMQAGHTLLENGGEVYRVQQTMYIMAHALGLHDFHAYVLANGVFASAEQAAISDVLQLVHSGMHLGRVAAVNALSRAIVSGEITDLDEAEHRLNEIRTTPASPLWAQTLSSAVGAACFGMLFGGSLRDGAAAALAGLLLALWLSRMAKMGVSELFTKLTGSALITAVCLTLAQLVSGIDHAAATIGALMLLTPGVAFTNGIGDLLHGDYLSGSIRLLDALVSGAAIASGVGLVYGILQLAGGIL